MDNKPGSTKESLAAVNFTPCKGVCISLIGNGHNCVWYEVEGFLKELSGAQLVDNRFKEKD